MEPKQIGRYVVESVLGKGAMGVVYLARDPVIGRRLALKTLNVKAESEEAEEFAQRFVREAQAVGMLNHPGVVTVHDAGIDQETGLSFIAMEYIEGKTLKDFLRSGQGFAYSEVARMGAALAGALDYGHSKGVVHRDIKPANIIVTPQGAVKITDFGVARLESSNLTATGQFIGTPNYMSPEQVTGGVVTGRSDLFSLGVVLFEMLTGQRPFQGASLTEVSYKIVNEPPPIPSQVRPGVPPAFNPIVLKLLEKDPDKRYQRGNDVARALDALRRVLAGTAGETTRYATPPPGAAPKPNGSLMHVAPTATKATEAAPPPSTEQRVEAPRVEKTKPLKPASSSIWRLPIMTQWVLAMLGVVVVPPALVIAFLLTKIDRGPWVGPLPGEPERRHRVAVAQRLAAAELAAGRTAEALERLRPVWSQAPYSSMARALAYRANELQNVQRDSQARTSLADGLIAEGKELYGQRRWSDALDRFERALALVPADPVATEYADLARQRLQLPRSAPNVAPASPYVAPRPTAVAVGEAQIDIRGNLQLSAFTIELDVDGRPAYFSRSWDFRKKTLFWKKDDTGVAEASVKIRTDVRSVTIRVKDVEGQQVAQQQVPISFRPGGRYSLKIEQLQKGSAPEIRLSAR